MEAVPGDGDSGWTPEGADGDSGWTPEGGAGLLPAGET